MNLVNGRIISDDECDRVLERLNSLLADTLRKPPLDTELVINACDIMAKGIDSLDVVRRLPELGVDPALAREYMQQVRLMLDAEAMRERLRLELGGHYGGVRRLSGGQGGISAAQTVAPLGVLFHITAGNVDGLPFVSLLDGLLTGNINIVKLPGEEGGVTVSLLEELFKIEPSLREYVYVFDYTSKDIHAMRRLAEVADAVVVWGGDEAVGAVRRMAAPNTKIIEWGHKLSFAYVTRAGASRSGLAGLAHHICLTNQLFCSSCQGIFLDTGDMREVHDFCEEFLPILESACAENPLAHGAASSLFIQAGVTLEDYHRRLERGDVKARLLRGEHCSVTARSDSRLESSPMYRNIWVKPLKREDIITLRPYKGYLQTAGLLCSRHEREELAQALLRAGVVKVSGGREMSGYLPGEAHDGVFSLRCYTRLVSVQED